MSRLIVTNVETQNIKFDSDTTAFSINSSGVLNTSSIVVKGEGTATTNLQQGLTKNWCTYSYAASIQDSFNVSGITDEATASHTLTFTNSMTNDDYSAVCGAFGTSQQTFGTIRSAATSSYRCNTYNENGSADERDTASSAIGDLA